MFSSGSPNDKPVAIRRERRSDVAARESLLDAAFGPGRFARTSERLRDALRLGDSAADLATVLRAHPILGPAQYTGVVVDETDGGVRTTAIGSAASRPSS